MGEHATFEWEGGSVSGVWHHPPRSKTYLVLGHGAGGNMHTPGLVQYAEALADAGVGVVRFNFPYAEARRKVPDLQPRLVACFRAVVTQVRPHASRLYLGGRSMGGRIASHVVADGYPAAGLVFLSYPLHPPGQPHRLRTAHLSRIQIPMLFLQGTRDAFARPDLLRSTIASLPTATLHLIEGAGHGLTVKVREPHDITEELVRTTQAWIRS